MDESSDVSVLLKDQVVLKSFWEECRAASPVPSLKDKFFYLVDSVEDSATTTSRDELEEIVSSDEYRKSHLSPRLEEFRAGSDHTVLNLEKCFLGTLRKRDVRWLAKFMSLFPHLKSVNLKGNALHTLPIDIFVSLIIGLKSIDKLEELVISCNHLAHDLWQWEQWCGSIFRSPSLLYLNLANNHLSRCDESRLMHLEHAFLHSPQLKRVGLANNGFGKYTGVRLKYFFNTLRCLPLDCEVDLSWNSLGDLEDADWFMFLNYIKKHNGRIVLDHNQFDNKQQVDIDDIYKQRAFEGKTGGKLYNLAARMIWARPDLYEYDEAKKTLNHEELPEPIHHLLQSQASFRRC